MLLRLVLASLAITSACAPQSDAECDDASGRCVAAGKQDGADGATCDDARYANGVCEQVPLCGMPDPDCFRLFASLEEANAAWPHCRTLPVEDARYQRVNGLLTKVRAAMRNEGAVPLGA